jgi:uncharacterized protein (DUF2147 family)
MKNLLFLFITGLFTLSHAKAQTEQTSAADSILRIWQTEEKDGRIQMLKNRDTFYAQMLWGKQLLEADSVTYKKDIHNPDPALRTRELRNYTLISGLVYKDGKWVTGKIYNFNDGNSYDVNIELKNGLLYMRVYKGIPMFGKTLRWSPVP